MILTAALLIALIITLADMAKWATSSVQPSPVKPAEPSQVQPSPVQPSQVQPAEPSPAGPTAQELSRLSIRELKALAKALIAGHGKTPPSLKRYGHMPKAKLAQALSDAMA